MAHHKKLADEALSSDYVIQKNAFADRKLQKQLDQLERMQTKERRRLEKEEHYFTVLHQVVPALQPGGEATTQTSAVKQRPGLKKRLTYPAISVKNRKDEGFSFRADSGSMRGLMTSRTQSEVLNLKDIACDVPDGYEALAWYKHKWNGLDLCSKNAANCGGHFRDVISGDSRKEKKNCHTPERDLHVKGSQLGERKSHASQQFLRYAGGDVSAHTKCMQYVNENGRYLHDVDSMAVQSLESDNEEEHNGSIASNETNASDGSSSNEEKLPDINNVGLRLMGYNPSTQKMKMLYQLREGQLDLPRKGLSNGVQRTSATEGELLTLEKLCLDSRKLRPSSNREPRNGHAPLQVMHSDPQLINVTQVTLVKFLPKCKQALYLKDNFDISEGLRKSWHAGDNT